MVIVIQQGTDKAKMQLLLKKLKVKDGVDTKKYCGVIKMKEDALTLQRKLRNEWE